MVGTVSNSSTAVFSGTARVSVEGRDVGSAAVQVPAGESTDVSVVFPAAGRGGLQFSSTIHRDFLRITTGLRCWIPSCGPRSC